MFYLFWVLLLYSATALLCGFDWGVGGEGESGGGGPDRGE